MEKIAIAESTCELDDELVSKSGLISKSNFQVLAKRKLGLNTPEPPSAMLNFLTRLAPGLGRRLFATTPPALGRLHPMLASARPASGITRAGTVDDAAGGFYIDGAWVTPLHPGLPFPVVSPATELPVAHIHMATPEDVDQAVLAARTAFGEWAETPPAERARLVRRLGNEYQARAQAIASAISQEMGAPMRVARQQQTPVGLSHIRTAWLTVTQGFEFEAPYTPPGGGGGGTTRILHSPIGVCGLITPWNWPMNQVTLKVAPGWSARSSDTRKTQFCFFRTDGGRRCGDAWGERLLENRKVAE